MTDPITPPPELVEQWWGEVGEVGDAGFRIALHIATQAARWGANQELETCCEWVASHFDGMFVWSSNLRAARRPKPPSLKEQALEQLECIQTDLNKFGMGISTDTIRRALEALPE